MPNKMPSPRALEQARTRLDDALVEHPDDPTLLLLRGRADTRVGHYADAAQFFERAAEHFHALGDSVGEASARLDEAISLSRAGFDQEARAAYHLAIAASTIHDDTIGVVAARLALSRHELAHREFDAARLELERCLEPLAAAQAHDDLGWVCERLVELTRQGATLDSALEHARTAVRAAAQARDREAFGARLGTLGLLHREAGHPAKARSYLTKALPYLRESGAGQGLLDSLVALADLADARGQDQRSLVHLEEALTVADRGTSLADRRRVRLHLAARIIDESPRRARRLVDEVLSLVGSGSEEAERATWVKIASLQSRLGEADQARASLERGRRSGSSSV